MDANLTVAVASTLLLSHYLRLKARSIYLRIRLTMYC